MIKSNLVQSRQKPRFNGGSKIISHNSALSRTISLRNRTTLEDIWDHQFHFQSINFLSCWFSALLVIPLHYIAIIGKSYCAVVSDKTRCHPIWKNLLICFYGNLFPSDCVSESCYFRWCNERLFLYVWRITMFWWFELFRHWCWLTNQTNYDYKKFHY